MIKRVSEIFSKIESDFEFAPFEKIIQPIIEDALKEHQKDKGCGSFESRIKAINNGMLGDLQTKLLRFFSRITSQ